MAKGASNEKAQSMLKILQQKDETVTKEINAHHVNDQKVQNGI